MRKSYVRSQLERKLLYLKLKEFILFYFFSDLHCPGLVTLTEIFLQGTLSKNNTLLIQIMAALTGHTQVSIFRQI